MDRSRESGKLSLIGSIHLVDMGTPAPERRFPVSKVSSFIMRDIVRQAGLTIDEFNTLR